MKQRSLFLRSIGGAGIVFILSLSLYAQHPNVMVGDTYEERTAYPNEPSIVINPKNTDEMIVTTNGPIDNYYYSTDGGATWNMSGSYSFGLGLWGDPCVIADTSGNFYFFHLELLWANYTSYKIHCRRLSFAGDTLSSPSFIGYNEPKFQDKEWAAFDPLTNNLYVAWTEFDVYGSASPFDHSRILVSRSTDRGITWSTPDDVSQVWGNCLDDDETVEGAVPAIGPNGEVYLTWCGPEGIVFDRSTDYGETWLDEDIFVADNPGGWAFGPDEIMGVYRADGQCKTACDISQGLYRGHIYVVWSDEYNGSDDHDVWV